MNVESQQTEVIKQASLIIWDEAPLQSRYCFEAVERLLRDITKIDAPFGGKAVLLGGDFRQIPPVVFRGAPAQIVASSLKRSPLWQNVTLLSLTDNMRLENTNGVSNEEIAEYADFLLRVGEARIGTRPPENNSPYVWNIPVPAHMIPAEETLSGLIDEVYPDFAENHTVENYLSERVILATTNENVDDINDMVAQRIPMDAKTYLSADSVDDSVDNGEIVYPVEFLNTRNLSGIPPHKLVLKENMVVMLIRNLNSGACNGTRLRIERLYDHAVKARILCGASAGTSIIIHRMKLSTGQTTLPFSLIRHQFPLKPCYAMTINKSQGQSLTNVGIYLTTSTFCHGQLYVALSRAKDPRNVKVIAPNNTMGNVVFPPLLA